MNAKLGFKALAFAASDLSAPISPCPCSLLFRCDDAARQATLLLFVTVPTASDSHTFALQYDIDQLLAGTARLSTGSVHVPQDEQTNLLRDVNDGRPEIKTLAFTLRQPAPLWRPAPAASARAPSFGDNVTFCAFVQLAKATTLYVIFDYKYLHQAHRDMFKAFSKATRGFSGYPVDTLLTGQKLRRGSWDYFPPVDAIGAPPAYKSLRKRPRQVSPTSAISQSSPKRFAPNSPSESHSSDKTVLLSPATAEAIERRYASDKVGAIDAAMGRHVELWLDNNAKAIDTAIANHLPIYLDANVDVLKSALAEQLPFLLEKILPTLFGRAPPLSNSTTPTSSPSRRSKLPHLSALGRTLLPHLRAHLQDQFRVQQAAEFARFEKQLDHHLSNYADDARAQINADTADELAEHRTDMQLLREDAVRDLSTDVEAVFDHWRVDRDEQSEALREGLKDECDILMDRIGKVRRTGLKRMIAREVGRWKRTRKGVPKGVCERVRGTRKLLGQRRVVDEDDEWVDIEVTAGLGLPLDDDDDDDVGLT